MKISEALEAYLVASNLREESLKPKKFYASDMGKCHRTRYLKRKGIKTQLTPLVYWVFKIGELMHEFGYKALEAQQLLIQNEETVESEHFVCRFDGLVKRGTDDKKEKPAIFDFKSAGAYPMKKAMAGAANEENILQVLTGIYLYKPDHPEISDTGILCYLNKEPGDKMPVVGFDCEFNLTNTRKLQIKKEMETLVNYWVDEKIPPCTCPGWMKDYNSFLPFCQMSEKDIKKYLKIIEGKKTKVITTKSSIMTQEIGDELGKTKKEIFHL